MTAWQPDDPATVAAVEALVQEIEAKEARQASAGDVRTDVARRPPRGSTSRPSPVALRRPWIPLAWDSDPPTSGPPAGFVDRQQWWAVIEHEAERQDRYGDPAAVVLAELAGFDPRTGPRVIDRLVPSFVRLLASMTRASDRVTRLSSARFGILLIHADAEGAARFAARATLGTDGWLATSPWDLRLAVGWAAATSGDELRDTVRHAEDHLAATHGR